MVSQTRTKQATAQDFNIIFGTQRIIGEIPTPVNKREVCIRNHAEHCSEAVYVNGERMYRGEDYIMVDRGKQIRFSFNLRPRCYILVDYLPRKRRRGR